MEERSERNEKSKERRKMLGTNITFKITNRRNSTLYFDMKMIICATTNIHYFM